MSEVGWLVLTMLTEVTRTVLLVWPMLFSVGEKICNGSGLRVSPGLPDTL